MSLENFLAKLRVEIREKTTAGAENAAPWSVLCLNHTPEQAAMMIKWAKLPDNVESRVIPNDPLVTTPPPAVDSAETKSFLESQNSELLGVKRDLHLARTQLQKMSNEKAATAQVDALAGQTPPPFKVGQLLRDVHTGIAVRVTREDDPHWQIGNPERGFYWVNMTTREGDKDHTGFCPFKSAGCFVPIKEGDPLTAQPTGAEVAKPTAA